MSLGLDNTSEVGSQKLSCLLLGTGDLGRRIYGYTTHHFNKTEGAKVKIQVADFADARAALASERPDLVLVEINHYTKQKDLSWIRTLLLQIRNRYGKNIRIICAVSTSKKFVLAGNLLFSSQTDLSPSGLIDSYIIAPPSGIPSYPGLEEQFVDLLEHLISLSSIGKFSTLPSLWENNWVPSMCDPESRNVWFRWLPRYASYINENPIIVGPTGSGKTRLAAAIHSLSNRTGPFICITPRDFSSSELVQAELFGAAAGAYTGAIDKWGLVKKAEKGTLFIDELQSIDRDLQGKLITFIEDKSYRRVGEAESHKADVRFIFATNRTLSSLVEDGSIRDDFAYRLERLQITLAPLEDRRLDISAAICFGLAKVLRERSQAGNPAKENDSSTYSESQLEGLTEEAYASLFSSSWPGNLRQLENSLAKMIELANIKGLKHIDVSCSRETISSLLGKCEITSKEIYEKSAVNIALMSQGEGFRSIADCLSEFAEQIRSEAIEHSGGNIEKAAELISESEKALKLFVASRQFLFSSSGEPE